MTSCYMYKQLYRRIKSSLWSYHTRETNNKKSGEERERIVSFHGVLILYLGYHIMLDREAVIQANLVVSLIVRELILSFLVEKKKRRRKGGGAEYSSLPPSFPCHFMVSSAVSCWLVFKAFKILPWRQAFTSICHKSEQTEIAKKQHYKQK